MVILPSMEMISRPTDRHLKFKLVPAVQALLRLCKLELVAQQVQQLQTFLLLMSNLIPVILQVVLKDICTTTRLIMYSGVIKMQAGQTVLVQEDQQRFNKHTITVHPPFLRTHPEILSFSSLVERQILSLK